MVAALALLAGFTAAASSTMHLNLAQRSENSQIARDLAESAIAQATARVMNGLTWTGEIRLENIPGLPEKAVGTVTFDRSKEAFSTNNYDGSQPAGWKRPVPPRKIHLVGTGKCGDIVKRVEVMLHCPDFPVSTASDGQIVLRNALVGGFTDATQLSVSGGVVSYDPDQLSPGDLCTNSQSDDAVVLDPQSQVTGDIQARGGVQVNSATVGGEVRARYGETFKLPNLNIADFDPGADPNTYCEELAGGTYGPQTLTGIVRYGGTLVVNGDLKLDNGMVFVAGNLQVNGGVTGQGAIFVTGTTTVTGTISVTSNDEVALFGAGDVRLTGGGSSSSVFQGLVYTRGNFTAKSITVVGSFIAESSGGVGGGATLEDAKVFYTGAPSSNGFYREVQAVLPRWTNDAGRTTMTTSPTGYSFGAGAGPVSDRTVDSVMGPASEPSNWREDDPFVIKARQVNGQVLYWTGFRGRTYEGDPMPPAWTGPLTRTDMIAFLLASVYENQYALENMAEHIPPRGVYEANLNASLDAMEAKVAAAAPPSWGLDPNRFLTETDELRQLFRADLL